MRRFRPCPLLPLAALVLAPAATTAFLPPASLLGRVAPSPPARPTTRLFEEPGDVRVTAASVFPTIPDDVLVDVSYAEQSIAALGTIGELIEAYHTGLIFEVQDWTAGTMPGVPEKFTVEWYALNFPFGAFLPAVKPLVEGSGDHLGLEWENEAYAFYNPTVKPSRWSKGTTPMGTVSGATIAKYADWVVAYCRAHPGYQPYDAWDRAVIDPGKSRRFIEAFTCATFAEGSLNALHELAAGAAGTPLQVEGQRALRQKELIKRSYVPMITGAAPVKVDATDPEQARGVRDFYVEMRRAAEGDKGEGYDEGGLRSSEFIRFIGDKLDYYYVYDTPRDEYYRLDLVKPYIALTHLYQPMSLPWQRLDLDGDGTLQDPAAFREGTGAPADDAGDSFLEDFAGLGSEVGGLLKRQLPKVLEKKVGTSVNLPVVGAAVVLLLVVVLQFDGLSFWTGTVLGVFLGVKGSQLLSKDK